MIDAEWLWSSSTIAARVARGALLPVAAVFRVVTTLRDAAYSAGVLPSASAGLPTLSVGNLSVGGTGKTPIAAWLAAECTKRGAHPAILLRGVGDDETKVHALLNPGVVVVADADRLRGSAQAVARGADLLILDDAFQHRRIQRDADVVIVSADAADVVRWPLPAGPWREPFGALSRARLVVITRKAASNAAVDQLIAEILNAVPRASIAVVRIAPGELVQWNGTERHALATHAGANATGVSAIGDPAAFEAQLAGAGLRVRSVRFPDHHAYAAADVSAIVKRALGTDLVISTLKDAVKLGPLWPRGAVPLWYLSQHVIVERGEESIAALVTELVAARRDELSA